MIKRVEKTERLAVLGSIEIMEQHNAKRVRSFIIRPKTSVSIQLTPP